MFHFDIYKCLLCYNYFSPLMIQLTSFFSSIIGCILTKYGISVIPFHIDDVIYRYFFFINIPYFIIIILFNLTFFIFRCANLMNNELNLWGFGLSIIEIYISIFGILTNLINDIMVFYNISNFKKLSSDKKQKKFPIVTEDQIMMTKIIFLFIFLIWINILFLSISDSILINFKSYGSYYSYNLAIKTEKIYEDTHQKKKKKKKKKQKREIGKKNNNKEDNIKHTNNKKNETEMNNNNNNIENNESITCENTQTQSVLEGQKNQNNRNKNKNLHDSKIGFLNNEEIKENN